MSAGSDNLRQPFRGGWITRERDIFAWLAALNLFFVFLALITYRGDFDFWSFPLSDLGVWRTPLGRSNILSALFFNLFLVIGGFLMASYFKICHRRPAAGLMKIKKILAGSASVGFFVALSPNDVLHVPHVAGCVAMIGALWFLVNVFSGELYRLRRTYEAWSIFVFFHLSFSPYAITYLRDMENKHAFQKLAFLGLLVSLTMASRWISRVNEEFSNGYRGSVAADASKDTETTTSQ